MNELKKFFFTHLVLTVVKVLKQFMIMNDASRQRAAYTLMFGKIPEKAIEDNVENFDKQWASAMNELDKIIGVEPEKTEDQSVVWKLNEWEWRQKPGLVLSTYDFIGSVKIGHRIKLRTDKDNEVVEVEIKEDEAGEKYQEIRLASMY